jgi:hypothetical protein
VPDKPAAERHTVSQDGMREQASAIEALVDGEIARIEQPELVAFAKSLRIAARPEERPWDYGNDGQTFLCWVAFAHAASNTAIAYCSTGFGPAYPWGVLFLTEPRNMGADSQWFASVEDALRQSKPWHGVNPPGYEVQ